MNQTYEKLYNFTNNLKIHIAARYHYKTIILAKIKIHNTQFDEDAETSTL